MTYFKLQSDIQSDIENDMNHILVKHLTLNRDINTLSNGIVADISDLRRKLLNDMSYAKFRGAVSQAKGAYEECQKARDEGGRIVGIDIPTKDLHIVGEVQATKYYGDEFVFRDKNNGI